MLTIGELISIRIIIKNKLPLLRYQKSHIYGCDDIPLTKLIYFSQVKEPAHSI